MRKLALPTSLLTTVFALGCTQQVGGVGGPDASRGADGRPGASDAAPDADPTRRKVFLASGHMGRTIMSCDDGLTWINDRSQDDSARCWVEGDPNYVECDHTPYSGQGLDAGDGFAFADYGWGFDGSIKRTQDGLNWEIVRTGDWGGNVVFGGGRLFSLWSDGSYSTDMGTTWTTLPGNVFADLDHPHIYRWGNRFIVVSRAAGAALSNDFGVTWTRPATLNVTNSGTFAEGNGVLISAGSMGNIARSTDGGTTFTTTQVSPDADAAWRTNLVFDGTDFIVYKNGQQWRSADGLTWTQTDLVLTGDVDRALFGGPVAFDAATGTFVTILTEWGRYYGNQRAYRSVDGVSWTMLDATQFPGGHPISKIIVAELASAACP